METEDWPTMAIPPLLSNALHTSWVGAFMGAPGAESAETCSCQDETITYVDVDGEWWWVVVSGGGSCGSLHAMGTLGILLKNAENVYKMVVSIQGAYKMDPAGTIP